MRTRRDQNTSGPFYVDEACINCGTCYGLAGRTFKEVRGQSAVLAQPANAHETLKALEALVCCPVAAIHNEVKSPLLKDVIESFPQLIDDNVFYCGFNSEKSYGASSYFIVRNRGNILVDSPRFVMSLVKRFEAMGGVKYLYLTHKDDVADHAKFKAHFGCQEIIHKDDYQKDFGSIDMLLEGQQAFDLADDLKIVPVPGHTRGHTVLLYKSKFLFTGDHLAGSEDSDGLRAFNDTCWYSWSQQISSMQKLLDLSFEWVLPGHGERFHADPVTTNQKLIDSIQWMKSL